MKVIHEIDAYYPAFHIGHEPQSIPCKLAIVEANDRRYLKTPFAMLNAYADDDAERQIGRGYYSSAADCDEYLAAEYPRWKAAQPIMGALADAIRFRGSIVGPGELADRLGVTTDYLYKLARGHKSCSLISKHVRALTTTTVKTV